MSSLVRRLQIRKMQKMNVKRLPNGRWPTSVTGPENYITALANREVVVKVKGA